MKAMVYEKYGSPEVLQLKEVPQPLPKENEVLVKIHAASINSWDWDMLTGRPRIYRLLFGMGKPKHKIIGCDIAGKVEAIGKEVMHMKVGDEVFGDISGISFGAFAEYVCASENLLAKKPASMSFEEAAAIPQAGVLALQGFRQGLIQNGKKVLINGAGGGVGPFAIQLAKMEGVEITAVDKTSKLDFMRSLGADHVLDYSKEDYSKTGKRYDLILDVMANRPIFNYLRALSEKGILVVVGGAPFLIILIALLGGWIANPKKMGLLIHKPNKNDLEYLSKLYESGKIKPVIDRIYPLTGVREAMQYYGEGSVKGKIVIKM